MLYSISPVPDRQRQSTKQRDSAVDESTGRTTITLPAFQLFELRSLKGIYGPTVTQVVEWIVSDWLAANQQNIGIRRKRYLEYLASRQSPE
jgi:hypothetical protein